MSEVNDASGDTCDTPIEEVNAGAQTGHGDASQDAEFHRQIRDALIACLEDVQEKASLGPGQVLVIGASSSEVIGERIGTATSIEVGETIVDTVRQFAQQYGFEVAFQCCEHLNRSLVMEEDTARSRHLDEVSAVPVPGAGGAVASVAYFRMARPTLVAGGLRADAGIDIGDTFIGMHLRHVAVPLRGRIRDIGHAHVTMATSRPPLIGGQRAVYDVDEARRRIGY